MKTPEEFAQEVMRTAYNATFYGERVRMLIAELAAARDAEVREAAMREAAVVAVRTARYSKADAEVCDEIAAAIIALAAPTSTPKPPESDDGRCADVGVHGRCELHAGHDGSHRNGEWTWTLLPKTTRVSQVRAELREAARRTIEEGGRTLERAAPPKGEAPCDICTLVGTHKLGCERGGGKGMAVAVKAKCGTCGGEKWCWRCGRCGHEQPDTYDQGCDKCCSDNIAVVDPCPTCRGTGDAP